MKDTAFDKIHNLILDIGLNLNSFSKEQKEFNKTIDSKVDKLQQEQLKTNLAIQQLNLSVLKLAEQTRRFDLIEERLQRLELHR